MPFIVVAGCGARRSWSLTATVEPGLALIIIDDNWDRFYGPGATAALCSSLVHWTSDTFGVGADMVVVGGLFSGQSYVGERIAKSATMLSSELRLGVAFRQ